MLEIVSWFMIAIGFISSIIIIVDVLKYPQEMKVMNFVWSINALFFGPIALWTYFKWGRIKASGIKKKDNRGKPGKVFVSTSHCSAGCSLGDAVGVPIVFITALTIAGSTLFAHYVIEFILAYVFGIIFQFYAIYPMNKDKGVLRSLKNAIKADSFALISFEIGMFGWMAIVEYILFSTPPKPNEPTFWFMMQIALILGFLTSYPANWWLVKKGIKEAM